ncbi:cytochrome P450 [Melanomma pulvis-pyrius CBS 109.77]|uniref:Cytochrome P450 n=1 Tax=Melanomma pulvis-pyrius CBS 109.77 TaxID=1314802 RepID=A0A6A6XA45_9PLEO|nr:cytochrome P450 [Melanomma pulvis-pyrius CBS 109.77]
MALHNKLLSALEDAYLWRPSTRDACITALAYLVWRVWTFNISPRLHPERPLIYPYWVPWVGNIASFLQNSNRTITQARLFFKNTRQPFTLVLGGQNVYIITSAQDTIAALKNVSQLSFDSYLKDMSARFGMSPTIINAAWRAHENTSSHPGGAIASQQLLPGPHMSHLQDSLLGRIHQILTWKNIPKFVVRENRGSEKVVSLLHLVRHTFTESTTQALFGEALQQVEPDIVAALGQFDYESWKFTYQVPPFLSLSMLPAKAIAQDGLRRYFELPESERAGACWMVQALETEIRALGGGSRDISASMMMLYWVATTNAWKATFWMVCQILYDPKLRRRVEEEIAPHMSKDLSHSGLQDQLNTLPLLNAIYCETLRTTASSISVRDVLEDCFISNVKLQKGSRLIIPFRQMLLDENVFGPDAEVFNPERFLHNPALVKNPSFRPFGGGATFCPGRFVAQQGAVTIVALLLSRLRIALSNPDQKFPIPNETKPCLGILDLKDDMDVLVTMNEGIGRVRSSKME